MNESGNTNPPAEERLLDLMIQQATSGLSDSEQQELDRLIQESENQGEPERFESIAAAIDVACLRNEPLEAMPVSMRDRILVDAGRFFGESDPQTSTRVDAPKVRPAQVESKIGKRFSLREGLALAVAAASIMLLLTGMNPFAQKTSVEAPVSVAQRMDGFFKSNPDDLVDIAWQPVHNESAGGRVVWSDKLQEGYMIFRGMKFNDPTVEQYQLWIFDNDPGQKAPVDGGIFNLAKSELNASGEIIVPIDAHVPIDKAVQFAVTVEKPGGVYVSKRENIPVLATIASAK